MRRRCPLRNKRTLKGRFDECEKRRKKKGEISGIRNVLECVGGGTARSFSEHLLELVPEIQRPSFSLISIFRPLLSCRKWYLQGIQSPQSNPLALR